MDAELALTELGLSGVTDADSLRRAYLRKVRVHAPERDPEGFQRVRAAYDFLRENPWLWPSLTTPIPSTTPADEPSIVPAPAPAQAAVPALDWIVTEAAPALDRDATLANAADPEGAPAIEPAVEREAEPTPPGRVHSVREILRTPALDRLFQKWIDVHDARALDDPAATARTMIELFEARVVGAETPLPAPEATFQLALVMFEKHETQLAGELLAAFEERSRADGSSHGLSSSSAALHKLLRELSALRGLAPKRLTALLASSIRAGEPPRDTKAIEEALVFVGPGFWEAFAQRAPTLFAMLRPFLPKSKTNTRVLVTAGLHRFGWWLPVLAVLQLARLVPQCSSAPEPARRYESASEAARSRRDSEPSEGVLRAVGVLEDTIDDALARKDCAALARDFGTYRLALRDLAPESDKLRAFMERRRLTMDICPALSTRIPVAP